MINSFIEWINFEIFLKVVYFFAINYVIAYSIYFIKEGIREHREAMDNERKEAM